MTWRDRLVADPNVCHGKVCVRGTRVMVAVILDNLAAGESPADIASGYGVALEDVHAAIQYAAQAVKDHYVSLPGAA